MNTPVVSDVESTLEPLPQYRISPTSEGCIVHNLKERIFRTSSSQERVRSTTHQILENALKEQLLAFHVADESFILLTEAHIMREVPGSFLVLLESQYRNWIYSEDKAGYLHTETVAIS